MEDTMIKRILVLLCAVLVLSGLLAGCKKEAPAPTSAVSNSVSQPQVPQVPQTPQVEDTYRITVYVDGWKDVRIWAWSNTQGDLFDAWPGEKMTPDGSSWYYFDVPTWVDNVLINGNGGTVQTPDLAVNTQDLWILTLDDGTSSVTYLDPAVYTDAWIGCEFIGHEGSFVLDPEILEEDDSGYIAELEGSREKVHLQDGSSSLNVTATVFNQTVYNCTEMTVSMQVEMNAGTSCKDWQVWGRCGGSFVKIGQIYLAAGNGFTSETLTFRTPITFDAIAITPTIPGGYSWSMAFVVTDVWTQ